MFVVLCLSKEGNLFVFISVSLVPENEKALWLFLCNFNFLNIFFLNVFSNKKWQQQEQNKHLLKSLQYTRRIFPLPHILCQKPQHDDDSIWDVPYGTFKSTDGLRQYAPQPHWASIFFRDHVYIKPEFGSMWADIFLYTLTLLPRHLKKKLNYTTFRNKTVFFNISQTCSSSWCDRIF